MRSSAFWKRFQANRPAKWSLRVFACLLFVSLFANFLANDRPIVASVNGHLVFPVLFDYIPDDIDEDGFFIDWLELEPQIREKGWALFPPLKYRVNEQNLNFASLPAPPGSTSVLGQDINGEDITVRHWIGTDTGGRDLLVRIIYGVRTSLLAAIAMALISILLGTTLGSLMGYIGGKFDIIAGRLLEAVGYFPVIFLIIVLVAFLETPGIGMIIVIFGLIGLSPYAFYMRGQVLTVRKNTYVEAAEAIGQSRFKILFSHILPNAFGPMLVLIPFDITANIMSLALVDYLGFGVQPPTASLGLVIRSGYDNLSRGGTTLTVVASLALVLILVVVNLVGEGFRDGLDPHATVSNRDIKALEDERLARLSGETV